MSGNNNSIKNQFAHAAGGAVVGAGAAFAVGAAAGVLLPFVPAIGLGLALVKAGAIGGAVVGFFKSHAPDGPKK